MGFFVMENVVNVYKEVGETPLEIVEKLKKQRPDLADKKMSYAGKLDPMAEGVLLVLVEEETRNQKEYQSLGKEYLAEVLFGVSTDSGDVLGLIEEFEKSEVSREEVADFVRSLEGKNRLPLPSFCSFEIEGKPLFWWAREGRLREIEIPEKEMEVYKSVFQKFYSKNSRDILDEVVSKVNSVEGDFRQEEVKESWESNLGEVNVDFPLVRFKVQCSSGTYVRSLAEELGDFLEVPSVLFSLVRTRVGLEDESFWAGDSLHLD